MRISIILLALTLILPAAVKAACTGFPTENYSFTGADSAATLKTCAVGGTNGYAQLHLYGGKQWLLAMPDGGAMAPLIYDVFNTGASFSGTTWVPYQKVYTVPASSTVATDVTQAATDTHRGTGDVTLSGTSGAVLIIGSDFVPEFVDIQLGSLGTAGTGTIVVEYWNGTSWVLVNGTGTPWGVDVASSATNCASRYCFDTAGLTTYELSSSGVTYTFGAAAKSNTVGLFNISVSCPTVGSNCWTPSDFVKSDIEAASSGVTSGADHTLRWYIRFRVSGTITTMPTLSHIVELSSLNWRAQAKYGGSGLAFSTLLNDINSGDAALTTTACIKLWNHDIPQLTAAGINMAELSGCYANLIQLGSTGDGGIALAANATIPLFYRFFTTHYASTAAGSPPVNTVSMPVANTPLKNGWLNANSNPSGGGASCGTGVFGSLPDYYDPNVPQLFINVVNFQAKLGSWSSGPGQPLDASKIPLVELDETDQLQFLSSKQHPSAVYELVTANPVADNADGQTIPVGQFQFYTKSFGLRDTLLNEYYCTGAGTPGALCTANHKGTYSADPSANGTAAFDGLTYVGSSPAATALTALNTAWGLTNTTSCTGSTTLACNTGYTTWNTSDTNGLTGISNGGANYTSYGTGTGLLDENGKRLLNKCPPEWFEGKLGFQTWTGSSQQNIYNDLDAFYIVYVSYFTKTRRDAYNTALGSTVPTNTRPLNVCPIDFGPDEAFTASAPYCDIIEAGPGIAVFPGSTTQGNYTEDPATIQTNLQGWVNAAQAAAGHTVPFLIDDFSASSPDVPQGMLYQNNIAGGNTQCQITSRTFSSPNTTIVAGNCPVFTTLDTFGIDFPDATTPASCPSGRSFGMLNGTLPSSVDYQYASTSFVVSGDWTSCLSVGNHVEMSDTGTMLLTGFGGVAATMVQTQSFDSWAAESTNHYSDVTNEITITDPTTTHPFIGQIKWQLSSSPFIKNSGLNDYWGVIDWFDNMLDGVSDTAAGSGSNGNCVQTAYAGSGVNCMADGYPSGEEGTFLGLFSASSWGSRMTTCNTLSTHTGCAIDTNTISYMITNDPIGAGGGTGIGTQWIF